MADTKSLSGLRRRRAQVSLMQYALRAVESSNRSREALDQIVRIIAEEQSAELPPSVVGGETPPPVLGLPPRRSENPTVSELPALTPDRFVLICRRYWTEAKTDEDRQAVHALVARAEEAGLIDDGVAEQIRRELT